MTETDPQNRRPKSAVWRIFANFAHMIGGKAAAGLISLVYLVIVARRLGSAEYGVLVMVHGYVTTVGGIIAFSGWHGLVRYGSMAVEAGDHGRLMRVTRLMSLIELGFGAIAITAAAVLAPVIGLRLGWSPDAVRFAVPYSLAIIATVRATPQGIAQIAGRFDLIGLHQTVSPVVRLVGALIVWWAGGGLTAFLMVWLAAAIAEGLSMWAIGLWTLRNLQSSERLFGPVRGARAENEGFIRFITTTNLDITLRELAPSMTPLIIGWISGPVAAGLFSLAQRATVVLQQPAAILGNAGYAVFARLAAAGEWRAFRHAVWRTSGIAMLASLPVLALIFLFSGRILTLLGGSSFAGGAMLVVLMALGRSAYLGAPALTAGLTAMGRPSLSILVNATVNLGLLPVLPVLITLTGTNGPGWHALIQGTAATLTLAFLFARCSPVSWTKTKPDTCRA